MKYRVEDLYREHGEVLALELVTGDKGLKRKIKLPEVERPGLALAGFIHKSSCKSLLVLGEAEIAFLKTLSPALCKARMKRILSSETPAVIVTRRLRPPAVLHSLCEKAALPLFRTSMTTITLLNRLSWLLTDAFLPSLSSHGTFVEVFGMGVFIQGESSVGKSEAALGLLERGHRLVSDDLVRVKRQGAESLEGSGVELSKHHMEVRGIGIINVAHLYGATCICDKKSLDIVVKLEVWDDRHFYDRVGLEEKTIEILGVKVPYYVLPVKPGRDVVLLLETITLNHRLKKMGYHSAKEFNTKLLGALTCKRS